MYAPIYAQQNSNSNFKYVGVAIVILILIWLVRKRKQRQSAESDSSGSGGNSSGSGGNSSGSSGTVADVDGTKLQPGATIQSNELLPQGATVADNGEIEYTGGQLSTAIDVLKDRKEKGEVNSAENVTADNCKSPPCPPAHCTISNSIMEKKKKDPKWGASFDDYTGPFKCSNLDGTGTGMNCQPNTSTFCTAQGLANVQSPLCADSSGTTDPSVMCYCPPLKCRPKACNGTSKVTNRKWACMSIGDETQCKADSACSWS